MGLNDSLTSSILATLSYHDLFDFPLTQKEIWKFFLLNSKLPPSPPPTLKLRRSRRLRRTSKTAIKDSIDQLIKEKRIVKQQEYYFLPGRKKIIKLRKKKEKYSQEKLKKTKQIIKLLKLIPWIKMVGITGALSMNNSDKDDDIDLMIITNTNRLWLTRLKLVIFLDFLGRRRQPKNKDIKDKFCMNLFLDETALGLSPQQRNLYTAHEVVQMKPIFNKNSTYEKFLAANLWVLNYLPNGIKTSSFAKATEDKQNLNLKIQNYNLKFKTLISYFLLPTSYFLNCLEHLAYQLQLKYMSSKRTREQTSPHSAFFHPINRIKDIAQRIKNFDIIQQNAASSAIQKKTK